jgi:hypothetical protein
VLEQDYPSVEHIVLDGGAREGEAQSVNAGLGMVTGEVTRSLDDILTELVAAETKRKPGPGP